MKARTMRLLNSPGHLLGALLVSLVCLIVLTFAMGYSFKAQNAATEKLNAAISTSHDSYRLANHLRQNSQDLTRMVRAYAATGDESFVRYFHDILDIRDGKAPRPSDYERFHWDFVVAGESPIGSSGGEPVALRQLMERVGFSPEELRLLDEAKGRSDRLVELEETAINAVRGRFRDDAGEFTVLSEPDRDLALQILFSHEYLQAKSEIMKPIAEVLDAIEEKNHRELSKAQNRNRSLATLQLILLGLILVASPAFVLSGLRFHHVTITTKKELQEERDRILAVSQDLICVASMEGHFTYLNPAWQRVLGYDQEELLHRPFLDFVHPDDHRSTLNEVNKLTQGEVTLDFANRYLHKDGSVRHLRWTATPIPDQNLIYCIARDVTLREESEAAVRASERRFRSLMEQSPLAIEILTPDGRIADYNPAWLTLWNMSEASAAEVLLNYNMISDEQVVELGIQPLVEKAFAGEAVVLPPIRYEGAKVTQALGIDVSEIRAPWIQCHLYPLKDRSGRIEFIVNTYVDMTEQLMIEQELRRQQERLRALARELTITEERGRQRIATELHDGAAQSLALARIRLADAREQIPDRAAARELDEASQIVRDSLRQIREVLLDLSSQSLHEMGLASSISQLLEEVAEKRHRLETNLSDEWGDIPLTEEFRVLLHRSTRELLNNVVKHGAAKRINVRMRRSEDELRIEVEDDGVGFHPETIADGRGFGLFSIRERMRDLGGSLEIVSAPGEGCVASLVAPIDGGVEIRGNT